MKINDKHIDSSSAMLRKVRIKEVGDTDFLVGEHADKTLVETTNERMIEEGKRQAVMEPLLLEMTRASLATESFSTTASSTGRRPRCRPGRDLGEEPHHLHGLKENVIMGRLVPAVHRDAHVSRHRRADRRARGSPRGRRAGGSESSSARRPVVAAPIDEPIDAGDEAPELVS